MKEFNVEFWVGFFLLLGLACFAYITTQFGESTFFNSGSFYTISAEFDNVTGLKNGANVTVAGVPVGRVSAISLTNNDMASVSILVQNGIRITEDAIASIKTEGLIGDKFIKISQGGADEILVDGDILFETESAIDIEEMVSQFIFGKV
jgi:phospholipid/cholesterol/gamma-HCH transport system substrate-binding protein